ncbi:MAG: CapA family protein [Prevotella sp.]|nr:CapA family protein [Prevotella sp.]
MKIALLGDIALYGRFAVENNPHLDHYFEDVERLLAGMDHVIGNLETPFVDKQKKYGAKSAHICCKLPNVEVLKSLHVSAVGLANNHAFDFGREAFELTCNHLQDNNIPFFGIKGKELFLEDASTKIALSGFCCYSTNPLGMGEDGVNILNVEEVERQMRENQEKGFFNIVSIHTGQEHVNYPNYDAIIMARKWAKQFDYVYYGHHPHVVQGVEKCGNSHIFYSLGNFCFDDVYTSKSKKPLVKLSDNNKTGMIVILEFEGNAVKNHETIPFYMGEEKMEIRKDLAPQFESYSSALSMPKGEYVSMRRKLLNAYIQKRKEMRNLTWYLKRLNLNSYLMIRNAKNNAKAYQANVRTYL